jgi:hypothetical protein
MAIKELIKPVIKQEMNTEDEVQKFISQGGTLALDENITKHGDHRLTLRIPHSLMDKIDAKRKERIGTISRNLMILEILEKALKK